MLSFRRCYLVFGMAALTACQSVEIKNSRECTVAGVFQAGMDCAETNTSKITQMDLQEMIDWLEPQPERPDPKRPGKKLPARAGAVARSDEDFTQQKIQLEQACVLLKDRCTVSMKEHIDGMNQISEMGQAALKKKIVDSDTLQALHQ